MANPVDILNESRDLLQGAAANPIRLRTVLGRAYYASMHQALVLALRDGFKVIQGRGSHQSLIDFLKASPHHDHRLIASRLRCLRGLRTTADYDLSAPITKSMATDCLQRAEDLFRMVEAAVPA